jgi:hypothetical protein
MLAFTLILDGIDVGLPMDQNLQGVEAILNRIDWLAVGRSNIERTTDSRIEYITKEFLNNDQEVGRVQVEWKIHVLGGDRDRNGEVDTAFGNLTIN